MPVMLIPSVVQNTVLPATYEGLDANGNTQAEKDCLRDPNCDMTALLLNKINDAIYGTGDGWLPCGTPENPYCGNDTSSSSVPSWVWLIGIIGAGVVTLEFIGRR